MASLPDSTPNDPWKQQDLAPNLKQGEKSCSLRSDMFKIWLRTHHKTLDTLWNIKQEMDDTLKQERKESLLQCDMYNSKIWLQTHHETYIYFETLSKKDMVVEFKY